MGKDEDPFGNGWISVYRSLMNKGFYKNSEYLHLWLHCLLRANHKDNEAMVDGNSMIIKRGQFLTSRNKLSAEIGLHESKVERILKFLETEQQIKQETTPRFRLISIINYDKYQNPEQVNGQHSNKSRTTGEQVPNTNNNDYNGNKGIKTHGQYNHDHEFQKFWELYPKKMHKDKAEKAYKRVAREHNPEVLLKALKGYMSYKRDEARGRGEDPKPYYFKNPENFLDEGVWKSYVDYRKQRPPL